MWNSNQYPELTTDEVEQCIMAARKTKGQQLYSMAYAKTTKGVRDFPTMDAKAFRDWITKRGQARAQDQGWKGFDVDDDNRNVINLLALYFTEDPRFLEIDKSYSFQKGIYLIGPRGVGKTQLMELCETNPLACYTSHKCIDIVGEFSVEKTGGQKVIDTYSGDTLSDNTDKTFGHPILGRFFDDLGQEKLGWHYQRQENVMEQICEARYNNRHFYRTHITSNLGIDQLPERYGSRVEDRFHEMFNVIKFASTAKSRRRN